MDYDEAAKKIDWKEWGINAAIELPLGLAAWSMMGDESVDHLRDMWERDRRMGRFFGSFEEWVARTRSLRGGRAYGV